MSSLVDPACLCFACHHTMTEVISSPSRTRNPALWKVNVVPNFHKEKGILTRELLVQRGNLSQLFRCSLSTPPGAEISKHFQELGKVLLHRAL